MGGVLDAVDLLFFVLVLLATVGLSAAWLLSRLWPFAPWVAVVAGVLASVRLARRPGAVVKRGGVLVVQRSLVDRVGTACVVAVSGVGAYVVLDGASFAARGVVVLALLGALVMFGVASARVEATPEGVRTFLGRTPWARVHWRQVWEGAPELVAPGCAVRVAYGDVDALHALSDAAGTSGPVRSF